MDLVPPSLKEWESIEDAIFDVTEKDVENILNQIKKYNFLPISITNLVYQVSFTRIFSFKPLAEIWKSFGEAPPKYSISPFLTYLCNRKLHKMNSLVVFNDERIMQQFENVFPIDSFGYAVAHDDIDRVIFLSVHDKLMKQVLTSYPGKEQLHFDVLSLAAYCGSISVFKYLMLNGMEIKRDTVIKSVMGGNEEIIQLISPIQPFHNCLKTAIQYHRNNIIQWLTDNFTNTDVLSGICLEYFNTYAYFFFQSKGLFPTPQEFLLKTSIQNECFDFVKYFVESGVPVNPPDNQQQQPLGQTSSPPLITAILQHSPKIVEYLLDKGADVEKLWVNHTPLLLASQYRNSDIVALLIKKGADVNSKGEVGTTSLIQAASNGHTMNVIMLVDANANLNDCDKYRTTALHAAVNGKFLRISKYLIDKGADMNAMDMYGNTPLHFAAANGLKELTNYMLKKGANPSIKNELGETPASKAKDPAVKQLFENLNVE